MSKKRKKQPVSLADKILVPLLCLSVIGSGVLVKNYKKILVNRQYSDILELDTIYNNIFINNYEVAGLTKDQAREKLEREFQRGKVDNYVINLQIPDGGVDDVIPITFKECGMKYNFEPELQEAYDYGRTGSAAKRREVIAELENAGKFLTSEYSYDRDMIIEAVKKHESEINSHLLNNDKLDVEKTADLIEGMLDINAKDSGVEIPVK